MSYRLALLCWLFLLPLGCVEGQKSSRLQRSGASVSPPAEKPAPAIEDKPKQGGEEKPQPDAGEKPKPTGEDKPI
jgi:hypothetical protein